MAMIAMQMNQQNQQTNLGQPPQTPSLGNIVQQLLIAQSMGAAQNGAFAIPAPQPIPPYFNEAMFSVGSIRRVMDEEPQLFWSRMREVGVLDELLDSITVAVDRIRALYSKRDSTSEEEEFGEFSALINLMRNYSRTSFVRNGQFIGFGLRIRRENSRSICTIFIDVQGVAK